MSWTALPRLSSAGTEPGCISRISCCVASVGSRFVAVMSGPCSRCVARGVWCVGQRDQANSLEELENGPWSKWRSSSVSRCRLLATLNVHPKFMLLDDLAVIPQDAMGPTLEIFGRGPITLEDALEEEANIIDLHSHGRATDRLYQELSKTRDSRSPL